MGLSFVFIPSIGFGSSFILKNGISVNYAINSTTILGGKTLAQAQAALTPDKISALAGVGFTQDIASHNVTAVFLRTTETFDFGRVINLFNQFLQPNSYNIQETSAFNSTAIINAAFRTIALSTAIMSIYFAVRFN